MKGVKMHWPFRNEILLSDDDRIQVLAFKKFLDSGVWVDDGASGNKFHVSDLDYQFATGKLSAKDYLSAKSPGLPEDSNQMKLEVGELFPNQDFS